MQFSSSFASLFFLVASASAAPYLSKRIAQTTIDAVTPWENACNSAGGETQCNPIAVNAAAQLLAAADACGQQDSADSMIDLAKTLNNNQAMITAAQIFAQQPRNSPNSVAVIYCQSAPKNQELNGFFQCQFQGSNQNTFTNGATVGQPGTIPFGLSAPVSPLGSCPGNPSGPIPDGVQISTLIQSPGTPASSSGSSASPAASSSSASNSSSSGDSGDTSFPPPQQSSNGSSSASNSDSGSSGDAGDTSFPPPQQTSNGSSSSASSGSSGNFQLSNGQTAQQQNAKFAQLTSGSSCTEGSQACVGGSFAQCVNGNFVLTQCGGGTQCFALPLVNKAGTSITCTTQSDAAARIAATGATGGITGSGSSSSASSAPATAPSTTPSAVSNPAPADNAATPTPSTSSSGFQLQNGQAAQGQNSNFASLTADSSCTEGEDACVDGGFAQCVSGKFVVTQCAGGTQCFALPLVNKPGTSIACTTQSDASSRIAATGATGGIMG
ncbi:hypothetical protein Clacol_004822 [Clathrus columnatus]|uniref:Carbohydrate-binding module family 19 domain-containing protein n=1 Tax=Clathrus columnatus TaxID=1419009 RepID=A0AAV5ACF0_9AGAM|nr:hypothetical protein Clacol_004822 [Clathrus columnatus]